MGKFVVFLIVLTLIFTAAPRITFAAAPDISSHPDAINLNESFTLNVGMDGLSHNTVYRLRMVLSPSGSSNYFGSTYNGSEWYNGTPSPIDYSKFLSITTDDSGSWSGEIKGKVDSSDSNYNNIGPSSYDLKVGRYTQTGSSATWSNAVGINLNAPTPTATPTQKPTPTPTKAPTPTKSPTPAPTKSLTSPTTQTSPKTAATASKTTPSTKPLNLSGVPTSILGANSKSDEKTDKEKPSSKVMVEGASHNPVRYIALSIGLLSLTGASFYFLRIRKGIKG